MKRGVRAYNSSIYFATLAVSALLFFAVAAADAQYRVQGAEDFDAFGDAAIGYDFLKQSGNLPPASTAIIIPMPTPPASAVFADRSGYRFVRATCNEACADYYNRKCVQTIDGQPNWSSYGTFSCSGLISDYNRTNPFYCMCAFREATGPPTFDSISKRLLQPGEFNYSTLGAYRFTWRAINVDRVDVTDGHNFYRFGITSSNDDPLVYVPDHDDAVLTFIAEPSDGSATITREVEIGNTVPKVKINSVTVDRHQKRILVSTSNALDVKAWANGQPTTAYPGANYAIFFDRITERTIYIIKAYGYGGSEETQVVNVDPVVLAVLPAPATKVVDKGNNQAEVSWEVEGTSNVRIECATSWVRYCEPFYSTNAKGSQIFSNIDPNDTIFTIYAYRFTNSGKEEVGMPIKLGGPSITQCMGQGVAKKFGEWQTYSAAGSCALNNVLKGDFIGGLGSAAGCMAGSMIDGAMIGVKDCGFDPNGDASCALGGARLMSQVRLPEAIPPLPTPLGTANLGGNSIAGAIGNLCGAPAASGCLLVPPPPLPSIGCGLVASMACQIGVMGAGAAIGSGLCRMGVPIGEYQEEVITALNTITTVVDSVPKIIDFISKLPEKLGDIKKTIDCLISGNCLPPSTTPLTCPDGSTPPCPVPPPGGNNSGTSGGTTGGGGTAPPPPPVAPPPPRCPAGTEVGCGCPYTDDAKNYSTQPKSYPTAAKRVVANALMTSSFVLSGGNLCLSTQAAYRCAKSLYNNNRDAFTSIFGLVIPYGGDLSQKTNVIPDKNKFFGSIKDFALTCGVDFILNPPRQCNCKGTSGACVTESICSG
ncbi:hypothetical protein HY622_00015 [Candidatus Uhrbacteria bacterium]|nr:hypothetical protein [Candidatus Uhrbacteria bacterium]